MAAYAGKAFYAQKIDLKCMEQSQDLGKPEKKLICQIFIKITIFVFLLFFVQNFIRFSKMKLVISPIARIYRAQRTSMQSVIRF